MIDKNVTDLNSSAEVAQWHMVGIWHLTSRGSDSEFDSRVLTFPPYLLIAVSFI